ncbi:tRNA wybutosine-synthesizing protein 2 [Halarchaeum rubridurum]|uniref:SAM-dependent methyltransferase n=1 Tax=Halarchaeum rubridurum TaxID=489911 RepID=A0A830FPW2_9EURY|nr:class I SAM-dependent methyltransferase family protein [Halarchaeum rubridurum]MBP1954323.1 tRNA wybutosine-synthesizing protein 2 [Halarchaeum rubridurum]GGM59076.1 SAM-dependent methyltransferase [Halarchaeum rubridurum]
MNALAVVVPKAEAEAKLDGLEAEGVYDDARKVREHDAERVELPVLAEPRATTFDALVEQDDPEVRTAGLDDHLRERGWDEAAIAAAPSSWAVVGDVVLVAFPDGYDAEERAAVGEALLDLHGEAGTVLAREGVHGEAREPAVSVVAGSGDTETIHTEHGTKYALDLAEVMFAPGNQAERARMGEVVREHERVLDMFAGVGYFALPMARAGAHVVAVERNPTAFRYLAENAQLNGVAERVECVLGDCRDYEATEAFDRVVMGYYDSLGGYGASEGDAAKDTDGDEGGEREARGDDAGERETRGDDAGDGGDERDGTGPRSDYLAAALDALGGSGTLHVHTTCPEDRFPERSTERVRAVCEARDVTVTDVEARVVKSHSEGVVHGVLDIVVGDG